MNSIGAAAIDHPPTDDHDFRSSWDKSDYFDLVIKGLRHQISHGSVWREVSRRATRRSAAVGGQRAQFS